MPITVRFSFRYIFWANWQAIFRANLDGTGIRTIVDGVDIVDLDIDFSSKEILWVENSNGHIKASDYDGNNQRVVCSLDYTEPDQERRIAMLAGSLYVRDKPDDSGNLTVGVLNRTTCDWVTRHNSPAFWGFVAYDSTAQPKGMIVLLA